MTRWLAAAVTTSARRTIADRGGLAFTFGFYGLVAAVITTLWRAVVEAGGGEVAGYTAATVTWYLVASEGAHLALNTRLIEEIGDDIASGAVAVELLRPVSVLGLRVAGELGRALPRLAGIVVVGTGVCLVTVGGPPSAAGALLALPAFVLAATANLLAQHAFAAIAFWIRDARSTWFLYQKVVFMLGGVVLPLEVLPDGVFSVAKALPFLSMAYVPGRLASGDAEPGLLLVQAGWIVVLAGLATAAFHAGERRLQVVGG